MTTLAIIVSDLHMGAGDALDRFAYDDPFRAFCKDVADYCRAHGDSIRFILNGDVIDLWTTVPDDELGAGDTANIRDRLEYPATTATKRRKAIKRGCGQIDRILESHPKVCAGLVDVMETPDPEVIYLVGNHDHGMMFPELQAHFSNRVRDLGGWSTAPDIRFPGVYENEKLRLYVEHGQQFSLDSSYTDFFDPSEADMGLYFLRFVGNRVRALYRDKTTWAVVSEIINWSIAEATGGQASMLPSLRFLIDYFEARRDGFVPDFSAYGLLQGLYHEWSSDPDRPPDVLGAALRDVFRSHPAPEYSRRLTASPDDTGFLRTLDIKGSPQLLQWNENADRYWAGAMHRLSRDDPGFPRRNPGAISNVVIGHTHKWRYQFLTADRVEAGRYFNSGSWTRDNRTPAYVWVTDQDPKTYRGLKHYPL